MVIADTAVPVKCMHHSSHKANRRTYTRPPVCVCVCKLKCDSEISTEINNVNNFQLFDLGLLINVFCFVVMLY
jgi:hypothetical protein